MRPPSLSACLHARHAPRVVVGRRRQAATSWAQAELRAVVAAGLMAKESGGASERSADARRARDDQRGLLHVVPTKPSTAAARHDERARREARRDARARRSREAVHAEREDGRASPRRRASAPRRRAAARPAHQPSAVARQLELSPNEPASHAEAAYSAARILNSANGTQRRGASRRRSSSRVHAWQKQILDTAVHFIGYPYVWGGESETTSSPYGPQVHGGFDCSGFVWRVYKLQAYRTRASSRTCSKAARPMR
jgi:cell wall-associated NlpC family hydrolase